jgi:hypothetical protein
MAEMLCRGKPKSRELTQAILRFAHHNRALASKVNPFSAAGIPRYNACVSLKSISAIKEFASDFLGAAAAPKPFSLADTPGSALIAAAAVGSSIKSMRDFGVDALGIAGAYFPVLAAIAGLFGCAYAIYSKTRRSIESETIASDMQKQYSFGIWTRRLAKVGFIAFVLLIPRDIINAFDDSSLLPTLITGVIIDAGTRSPIEGARVRVLAADGVDVTRPSVTGVSDSHGVFIAATTIRVRRNASLVIYRPDWKPVTSPLWRRFQTSVPKELTYVDPATSPFFSLHLDFTR